LRRLMFHRPPQEAGTDFNCFRGGQAIAVTEFAAARGQKGAMRPPLSPLALRPSRSPPLSMSRAPSSSRSLALSPPRSAALSLSHCLALAGCVSSPLSLSVSAPVPASVAFLPSLPPSLPPSLSLSLSFPLSPSLFLSLSLSLSLSTPLPFPLRLPLAPCRGIVPFPSPSLPVSRPLPPPFPNPYGASPPPWARPRSSGRGRRRGSLPTQAAGRGSSGAPAGLVPPAVAPHDEHRVRQCARVFRNCDNHAHLWSC
jgi:hypothetical protein